MMKFLEAIIAHPRSSFSKEEQVKRFFIHFPVGLLIMAFAWVNWDYGVIFGLFFLVYEILEDWRLADEGHVDLKGSLAGIGLGGIVLFVLKLVGVS